LSDGQDSETLMGRQALDAVAVQLRGLHGNSVNTMLFYGSCLRSNDPFEGIVDLYLLVDSYDTFYRHKIKAFGNWLLPPNVFYREFDVGHSTIRVKYGVLSITDLRHGLSGRWIHSYLWGRFSQPVDILWCRDESLRTTIEACLQQAAATFLTRILPRVPDSGLVSELWEQGLRLSYSAELRSEGIDRAKELVAFALEHYVSVSKAVAPASRYRLQITGSGTSARYTASVAGRSRIAGYWAWALRRVLGKFLSLARLIKALFTFEGGLDYAVWKLERHSGQSIEIPERVRRHPLIFVWPLFWRLYRRGVIR